MNFYRPRSREFMYLVASVCPSVRLSALSRLNHHYQSKVIVTDRRTESDAYEPAVQYAQVGSKTQ